MNNAVNDLVFISFSILNMWYTQSTIDFIRPKRYLYIIRIIPGLKSLQSYFTELWVCGAEQVVPSSEQTLKLSSHDPSVAHWIVCKSYIKSVKIIIFVNIEQSHNLNASSSVCTFCFLSGSTVCFAKITYTDDLHELKLKKKPKSSVLEYLWVRWTRHSTKTPNIDPISTCVCPCKHDWQCRTCILDTTWTIPLTIIATDQTEVLSKETNIQTI